ncbi:hypothetical protein J6590_095152 [Homalodisca vitripennis]|nr:hypothetical protein J6590_095152 [Homalodisca vitripennis]
MSRRQKLLDLALRANVDQPMTFIVNTDGSLTEVYNSTNRTTLPGVFDINLPENCINLHENSEDKNLPKDATVLDEDPDETPEQSESDGNIDCRRMDDENNVVSRKRKKRHQYFLKKLGTNVRVCKTMFLNTLSIGKWMALRWQGEDNYENSEEAVNSGGEVILNGEEWQVLPQRKNKAVGAIETETFTELYKERLPITRRKYNDLQDLKSILPGDYHEFYDSIPFV